MKHFNEPVEDLAPKDMKILVNALVWKESIVKAMRN